MKESIYGVDIDKGAVDISRLRFWLSLIVDEDEPSPLPNLDYKIMQGDSLKESFDGIPLDLISWNTTVQIFAPKQLTLGDAFAAPQKEIEFTIDEKDQLNAWVREYFGVEHYDQKLEVHTQIDKTIIDHLEKSIELVKISLDRQIGELKSNLKRTNENLRLKDVITHYKNRASFKTYLRQKSKLIKEELILSKRRKNLLELQKSNERPYFLWNLYFGDVLQEGNLGFDIVIGNPPYGVKVDDEIKDHYKLASKDSYGVFMSMAIKKLLKENGVLSFIVSDTWLTIKSHFELRKQVLNFQLRKIIRLHQDCFKATVNSCIFTLVKSPSIESSIDVFAADLTNISTRKEVPEFRDKLFNLENYSGQYTPCFAVYRYPQRLLNGFNNKSVVVGSPKVFKLMNDLTCVKDHKVLESKIIAQTVEIRKIEFNEKQIELVRFGDIGEAPHGISTGNNKKYIRCLPNTKGNYSLIEESMIVKEDELQNISEEEKTKGFKRDWLTLNNCFVPFDKGGEAHTDEGWLPNYYVPTRYYINWTEGAIKDMKFNPGFRWFNTNYFFKKGLTFSISGIYSPTFRISGGGIFEAKGSGIFSDFYDANEMLGIFCSKISRYLFKNYIKHTVDTSGDDIREFPILLEVPITVTKLVNQIIDKQQENLNYNYFENEQKEIDRLVYELYGLNEEDINEVETWFARRYPKLATYAYYKSPEDLQQKKLAGDGTELIKEIISKGESRVVEFKSSLRFCLKQQSVQNYVEHSSFKNLAAFLNSEGGHLFIGVEDSGEIMGLENTDFTTFKGTNKKDEFLKHLDNLTEKYFGNGLAGLLNVRFHEIDQKTIAVVEVKGKSPSPVFLKNPDNGKEEFYIRRNASAIALTMFEFYNYEKEQWKG